MVIKNNIFPRLKSGVFYPKEDVLSSSIHPRSEDRGILEVSNKFTSKEIKLIINQVFDSILKEGGLSHRSTGYIENLLKNGSFYLAVDDNLRVYGFIAKEKLVDNYYELKCWYVVPEKRRTGLADKLLLAAASDPRHKYIGATYQKRIVERVKKHGFGQISLLALPPKVLFKFVLTRQMNSISKHLFFKRGFFVAKL